MKPLSITITITFFMILLSSCTQSSREVQPALEGTTWILTSYNNKRPIEGTQPTIQFKDSQVSGKASCNHYGGNYQVKGNAINFDGLFNTEMACQDPEGVMEQEQTYLKLLKAAQRFELVDGSLTIFSGSQDTLTFEKQQ
jgi:heat shock protein HslJ